MPVFLVLNLKEFEMDLDNRGLTLDRRGRGRVLDAYGGREIGHVDRRGTIFELYSDDAEITKFFADRSYLIPLKDAPAAEVM